MAEDQSKENKASILGEFWYFVKNNKRYWLIPIIIMVVLLSVFILLTESSALAPFIYNIF